MTIDNFSGTVLEGEMNNDNTSGIENFTLPMKFISLHVTGPTLLYFYSDMGKEAQGFLIEYWYVVYYTS